MGWKTPTGHEDPDDKWDNEERAYDDNVNTAASSYRPALPLFVYSSPLILTHDAIQCDKIRFYETVGATYDKVRISVYKDGEWEEVWDDGGGFPREVEFDEGEVTKAKIEIHYTFSLSAGTFTMHEFDFWEVEVPAIIPKRKLLGVGR